MAKTTSTRLDCYAVIRHHLADDLWATRLVLFELLDGADLRTVQATTDFLLEYVEATPELQRRVEALLAERFSRR